MLVTFGNMSNSGTKNINRKSVARFFMVETSDCVQAMIVDMPSLNGWVGRGNLNPSSKCCRLLGNSETKLLSSKIRASSKLLCCFFLILLSTVSVAGVEGNKASKS